MEVDGGAETVAAAEAAGRALELLNLGVEAFDASVGDALRDGVEDARQVGLDHPRDSLDGLETRADGWSCPAFVDGLRCGCQAAAWSLRS